mgnify:CR=1 FL=1
MKTIRYVFVRSLPIMAGYIVLGLGFGVLLQSKGYGAGWALVMSGLIYAGSMQYVAIDLLAGGVPVGEAVSAWVLAGVEDRKLLRLSQMRELEGTEGGGLCKQLTLSKLRMPGEMEERDRRRMGYSDTDINGHVNNTRYADFVCDALRLEGLPRSRFLSELQIGYTAESRAGDVLTLEVGEQGGQHFVKGVDEAGKTHFEAAAKFGEEIH